MAETVGRFFVTPCKAHPPAISGGQPLTPPPPPAVSGGPPPPAPSYGRAPSRPRLTNEVTPHLLNFQGRRFVR